MESLEGRRLLAGLVNLTFPNPSIVGTDLTLTGDGDDNSITIESTGAGSYLIKGVNGTLLSKDGGITTFNELPVNGIAGPIISSLGQGSDTFAVAADKLFSVPTSLTVNEWGFGDTTNLAGAMVPQSLTIQNDPAAPANSAMGSVRMLSGVSVGGNLVVQNGAGTNTTVNGTSSINGNIYMVNRGTNTNKFDSITVGGDLWISKGNNVGATSSHAEITNSNIVGSTVISNVDQLGAGGTSSLKITNSQLQGRTVTPPVAPIATPGGMVIPAAPTALTLTNGLGKDTLEALGSTTFGAPIGVAPAAPLPNHVVIVNGGGGSMITFGGVNAGDVSRVKVNGNVTINNGANVPGVVDMASFDQTDVLGAFTLVNSGGPGATNTMITDSNLGTFLAPAGPGGGSPVTISNDAGEDAFNMSNSTAPWGLFINNDVAGVNNTPWGSSTTIQNSSVGMRLGGPANPTPVFPGGALNPVAGDGLAIFGGAGIDTVKIEGAQMQVGGQVSLNLRDGNNVVEILGNAGAVPIYQSIVITTSNGALLNGNDTITLQDVNVVTNININLANGIDVVKLKGATKLPANGVGTVVVNGGGGVLDKLEVDATVMLAMALPPGVLPFGFTNFEL
jgi:hypothetical protein